MCKPTTYRARRETWGLEAVREDEHYCEDSLGGDTYIKLSEGPDRVTTTNPFYSLFVCGREDTWVRLVSQVTLHGQRPPFRPPTIDVSPASLPGRLPPGPRVPRGRHGPLLLVVPVGRRLPLRDDGSRLGGSDGTSRVIVTGSHQGPPRSIVSCVPTYVSLR